MQSTDGDGMLVSVRRSKAHPKGKVSDVQFLKDGIARVRRSPRAGTTPEPGDRVVPLLAQMIGLRFTAVARAASLEGRVNPHSDRVWLTSPLTSRGASTTDVVLADN